MKKGTIYLAVMIIVVMLIGIPLWRSQKIDMNAYQEGMVCFGDMEKNCIEMKRKDLEKVKKIFHNKKLYRDNPSCGFLEEVSIVFDDGQQIFEPACDGCGIVYWKNKNKYFLLTDEETTIIHGILQTYNLKFPCV